MYYRITHFAIGDAKLEKAAGLITEEGVAINIVGNSVKLKVVINLKSYRDIYTDDTIKVDVWACALVVDGETSKVDLLKYNYSYGNMYIVTTIPEDPNVIYFNTVPID